jgi:glycosyltransferase involved in cell wall biosynthesis
MRIALLNSYYVPDSIGGVETMVRMLATGLRTRGHAVTVVTTGRRASTSEVDGIPVMRVAHHNAFWAPDFVKASKWRAIVWNARTMWNPAIGRATVRALRAVRPDVIHLHNPAEFGPLLYWQLRQAFPGVPIVQTLHGFWHTCIKQTFLRECRSPVCTARRWYLTPFTRIGVDAFVTPSAFVARAYGAIALAARAPIRVIYNGVDLPQERVARTPRPAGVTRVLYLGQLQADKGVLTLLKAAAMLRGTGVEIAVAGAGPLRGVVDASPDVAALGWLDAEGKQHAFARTDVLVFPSECEETFGLSMVEAMAMGLPVIASRVGAIPEIVQDGVNGLIVPPGDAEALATALRIASGADLGHWGDAARRTELYAEMRTA